MKIIWYDPWNIWCNRQKFLSFWSIFCPFSPLSTRKIKILKLKKNTWRYYHYTHVYHKWQSYDVWFLRYQAQQTEFFVILEHFFCLFTPLTTQKIKILKKWKNPWGYYYFTYVYHKWQSYNVWFLRYEAWFTP